MTETIQRDEEPRANDRANVNAKRIALTLILALLLPILILWAIQTRQFRQLADVDAVDFAQVARNVQAGRGFITSVVRPLATTHSTDILRMPDMIHAPLFAYAEALVLATGPASDFKAFLTAALFFLLTIPVLYALAKGMFNQRVAQLSVFAYVCSLFMTNMVISGGPGTMVAFVFTLLCLGLFRYAQAADGGKGVPNTRAILLNGGICGFLFSLCYLTDYMLLFAFLPVAFFIVVAGKREGKFGLLAFLLVFAVLGGGWMVRNTMLTGNPFFGMRAMEIGMNTTKHPGMTLYRTTNPQTMLSLLQEVKGELPKKLLQGVQVAYGALPVLGQPYLVAFFIAGLFYSFRRTGVNALRGMLIASLVFVAVFGSLFLFNLSTLAAFAPIMLAFAAAFFVRLLTDSNVPEMVARGVTALALLVLIIPLGAALAMPANNQRVAHELEGDVGLRVAPNVPILTDRAFEMAWYGSRTTIWIPDTEKDVGNLDKITLQRKDEKTGDKIKYSAVQAIFLSPSLPRTAARDDIWAGMYGNIYSQAARGQFARIDEGTLKGFALFRDLDETQAVWYLQKGGLLLMRDGASRPQ